MKKILLLFALFPFLGNAQVISTMAGYGIPGSGGDGGPATACTIDYAGDVVMDGAGNLYFSDFNNNKIRKINSSGIISTIAGTGIAGYSGDGGPAIYANLNQPYGVALDDTGNLYFVDCLNQRIRKINTSGTISTVAGTGIGGYNGDSILATAAEIWNGAYVCTDHSGNIYLTDGLNQRIRKVNAAGIMTTVAGTGTGGYNGDDIPAVTAEIYWAGGIKADYTGNLYITDGGNNRIRKVNPDGYISTIAGNGTAGYSGDGGPATAATLDGPEGLWVSDSGNVYFADSHAVIRKVDSATGVITTIAGNGTTGYGGDGLPATEAELNTPDGLCMDGLGNLYIADAFNYRIRKITYAALVTTGLQQIAIAENVIILPNPATTAITISSPNNISQITLTNLLGQTLLTQNYSTTQIQVDVADLPSGVYFVKINGSEVRKFVKE